MNDFTTWVKKFSDDPTIYQNWSDEKKKWFHDEVKIQAEFWVGVRTLILQSEEDYGRGIKQPGTTN